MGNTPVQGGTGAELQRWAAWTWTEGEREPRVWGSAKLHSRKSWDRSCVARHDLHVLGSGTGGRMLADP